MTTNERTNEPNQRQQHTFPIHEGSRMVGHSANHNSWSHSSVDSFIKFPSSKPTIMLVVGNIISIGSSQLFVGFRTKSIFFQIEPQRKKSVISPFKNIAYHTHTHTTQEIKLERIALHSCVRVLTSLRARGPASSLKTLSFPALHSRVPCSHATAGEENIKYQ